MSHSPKEKCLVQLFYVIFSDPCHINHSIDVHMLGYQTILQVNVLSEDFFSKCVNYHDQN